MKKLIIILFLLTSTAQAQWLPFDFFNKQQTTYNNIGIAGQVGFGVGVCNPANLPSELVEMAGTRIVGDSTYGNYLCVVDSSIMVFIPKFYYYITTVGSDSNYVYISNTKVNENYVLHRAFIDGGVEKVGFFVDKYKWSLSQASFTGSTQTSGIASSKRYSNPISSESVSLRNSTNNYAGSFSNCISNSQTPANNYGGAFSVAKSRGNNFFVETAFQQSAIALLSLAVAINSTDTSVTKWYHATYNFPKGNNNYGTDYNDITVTYLGCTDGYWASRNEARMNGGANRLDKTTHNGQLNGVADVNGNQLEVVMGMTSANYVSKTISAISRETEAIVTSNSHGFTNGTQIFIDGTVSTEWDAKMKYHYFIVSDATENTFKLKIPSTGAYLNTSTLIADYTSGFTAYTQSFYSLKSSITVKDVTAADHFNATWVVANMDNMGLLMPDDYVRRFGNSTNQVLSGATSGSGYLATSCGMPMSPSSASSSGTTSFGNDYYITWFLNLFCLVRSDYWGDISGAGVWSAFLGYTSSSASRVTSSRSAIYPN